MHCTKPSPDAVRLQRSILAVPATHPGMIDKALASDADWVLLDLEDAVAAGDKLSARRYAIEALNDLDWCAAGKRVAVRVNALDSHYFYRDLIEVLEQAGQHLDTVLLPKAARAADILLLDTLIRQIAAATGRTDRISVDALIETAAGLNSVEAIAGAAARLQALHFGAGDLAASLRARSVEIGGLHPDYPGDPWHAAMTRVATACRAHGRDPVDGPYADFQDTDGFVAAARRATVLGFEGKWAIHPCQVPLANRVFSPSDAEVTRARRILAALAEAQSDGRGAARFEGRMIDAASARLAANIVARDARIRARRQSPARSR